MTKQHARITGWGHYVPARRLTNYDLEQMVDTTDEWIFTRTGIERIMRDRVDGVTEVVNIAEAEQAIDSVLRKAEQETVLVGKRVFPMAGEYTCERWLVSRVRRPFSVMICIILREVV